MTRATLALAGALVASAIAAGVLIFYAVSRAPGVGCGDATGGPAVADKPAGVAAGRIVFFSDRDDPVPEGEWGFGAGEAYVANADGSGLTRPGIPALAFGAWSPDGRHIAFLKNSDIYVANADGSGETNVTNGVGLGEMRGWSPDAKRIAFLSGRPGPSGVYVIDIYVVNADATGLVNLTSFTDAEGDPDGANGPPFISASTFLSWSPDGTRIAFKGFRGGTDDIYAVGADGSGVTKLTMSPASTGIDWFALSPDGSRMLFSAHPISDDFKAETFVINSDGSGLTRIAERGYVDWSPDSSRIVFSPETGQVDEAEIFVMDADGSNRARLAHGRSPAWSPDGKRIAFHCPRDGNVGIYIIDVDGSNVTGVTPDQYDDQFSDWSPDGNYIAVDSYRDGSDNREVYIVAADGSGRTNVSNHPASDWGPQFAPGQ